MDAKIIGVFIASFSLLCVLVMKGSVGRLGIKRLLLGWGDSKLMGPMLHEDTGSMCVSEVMISLPPDIKHEVIKCLVRKGFHFDISGEYYRLENMYFECLELIHSCHPVLRRHLADMPQNTAPAMSPASGPSPASALSPNTRVEQQTPTPTRSPSYDLAPASSPPPNQQISVLPTNISPSEPSKTNPGVASFLHEEEQKNKIKLIIIAVLISSAGTTLLLACVFCCYQKCCRQNNSSIKERDEGALLHVGLHDLAGSPIKSFGPVVSNHKDKHGDFSGYHCTPAVPSFGLKDASEPKAHLPHPPGGSTLSTINLPAQSPVVPPPPPAAVPPPPAIPPPSAPRPPLPNRKIGARPPPPPPKATHPSQGSSRTTQPSNLGPNHLGSLDGDGDGTAPKTKLKPFFWDKVLANPDQSNVWHQIRSGSFQFDEDMIETLFSYSSSGGKNNGKGKKESPPGETSTQYIQLLDPKKSQNLAISLKALGVKKQEVHDALMEANELPTALLQTLLRMQPTTDEELKLRLYDGDLSLLGPAEQFLKDLVHIPLAYKRMDILLFMSTLREDVSSIKESFETLEVACTELRSNRLFLKLLEAVLKTGNRMNDGTYRGGAQAFKLDTLLKLSDVKGADGKTTLLHFVVQEIIRSEGVRAVCLARQSGNMSCLTNYSLNSDDFGEHSPRESGEDYYDIGLKVVSCLSSELQNVKKAAGLDADAITSAVASFGHRLMENKEFLNTDMKSLEENSGFHHSLQCFVENAEVAINFLLEEERRIRSLVQNTTDYFQGNTGKEEGLRLFVIVRDFLGMLDKACKEIRESPNKVSKTPKVKGSPRAAPIPDPRQLLFPAIVDQRVDSSSSDEEGP
ncbi:formin-like protein 3 isoform X1 [Musa acuminata AAA Group]|uniref:formin-like protein 3 isoform X1 n=1 Tax=Musa acuminata AAA Group TaxID=214697 RepID=UPI0031D773EC